MRAAGEFAELSEKQVPSTLITNMSESHKTRTCAGCMTWIYSLEIHSKGKGHLGIIVGWTTKAQESCPGKMFSSVVGGLLTLQPRASKKLPALRFVFQHCMPCGTGLAGQSCLWTSCAWGGLEQSPGSSLSPHLSLLR